MGKVWAKHSRPRHALITGGGGTLARALARLLVAEGCRLSICDRSHDSLQVYREDPVLQSHVVRCGMVDLRDVDATKEFVEQADDSLPIDWFAAVAGVTEASAHSPFEVQRAVLEANYLGAMHGLFPVIERMKGRKSGHLILVSSMSALAGFPAVPQYAASKAALAVFGKSLRYWVEREGIKITIACPGFFPSEMTKVDRPLFCLSAEEVARRIYVGTRTGRHLLIFPKRLRALLFLHSLAPYSLQARFLERQFPDRFGVLD